MGQRLVESALLHTNLGAVKCLFYLGGHRNLWAECETDRTDIDFQRNAQTEAGGTHEENISVVFIPCSS